MAGKLPGATDRTVVYVDGRVRAHGEQGVESLDEGLPTPRDPDVSMGPEPVIPPALQQQYAEWLFASQVYSLFGGFVVSVIWWVVLLWWQELHVALLVEPRHVFAPVHPAYTAVLALLAGVPTAEAIRLLMARLRFGDWVPVLRADRKKNVPTSIDSGVGSWLRDVVLVTAGGLLLLNWSTVFSEEGIRINRLFGLRPQTYRYADIAAIRTDLDAGRVEHTDRLPQYVDLTFQDGKEWSSMRVPWPQPDPAAVRLLEQYLRKRSGIPPGASTRSTTAAAESTGT